MASSVGDLTVIIPNYNHAAVLPRAVESHIGQSLPPRQILIVDDASTDESVAVAMRLAAAHPQVRVIERSIRGGPNAGIATGLAETATTFVRFAAADDFVAPHFLRNALASLDAHPDAALCFSDPSAFDPETRQQRQTIPLALACEPAFFTPDQFEALIGRNYFTISSNTTVFRRSAIVDAGGFLPELEWQADWFAMLVLAFRHGVCYRPEALAHFTVGSAGYGSVGVREAAGQHRLLLACLAALEGPYGDVAPRFRRAALVPEMRLRTLFWLLGDPRGRAFVTPRLAGRLATREVWTWLRPLAPSGLRRWLRRRAAGTA